MQLFIAYICRGFGFGGDFCPLKNWQYKSATQRKFNQCGAVGYKKSSEN